MLGPALRRRHEGPLNLKEHVLTMTFVRTLYELIGAVTYQCIPAPHLVAVHARGFGFCEEVAFHALPAGLKSAIGTCCRFSDHLCKLFRAYVTARHLTHTRDEKFN